MRIAPVATSFFFVFEALTFVAERVHAIEFVGDFVDRHVELPPVVVDIIANVIIATGALLVCLRVARWLEIRSLVRHAGWQKTSDGHEPQGHEQQGHEQQGHERQGYEQQRDEQLRRYGNRVSFRLNLRSLGLFIVSAPILEIVAKIAIIERSAETIAHWAGPLGGMALHFWQPLAFSLLAWGSIVLSRRLWLARLQDIELPADDDVGLGDLLNERDLRFRLVSNDPRDQKHTAAALDIKRLAATETYGVMGDTDFPQVFAWWAAYPRGNWLAEYEGRVVGGIDIWPLKKAVYEGLRAGRLGEEDIDERSLAPRPDSSDGSYWYVASISLDMRMRQKRFRKAVLAKLIQTMMEQNFLASSPAFPARVITLIWTRQGDNIAQRSGFRYVDKRVSDHHAAAKPIYEIVFDDEAAVRRMVAAIKPRLASRAMPSARPLPGIEGHDARGLGARPVLG